MKIIVGLGNPGKKYEKTRHNIGYCIIDAITKSSNLSLPVSKLSKVQSSKLIKKFNAEIAEGKIDSEKVLLVKPQTFMNNSGEAVRSLMDFYKINPENIWVTSDDIDLLLGKIRIRKRGSSGGHKGLQSIIDHLGTQNFPRIRVGIRNKELGISKIPAEEYVLQKFSKEEQEIIDQCILVVVEEIITALDSEIEEKSINILDNCS